MRSVGATAGQFYPYEEAKSSAVQFATYTRESNTGNDYADQRYYTSAFGRFMTPDPYAASGGSSDPGSWNRYTYTKGDPVNRYDPHGFISRGFCLPSP